jgi:hypothetical protein
MYQHEHGRPAALPPSIPEDMRALVGSLLEKRPGDRPRSAAEVGGRLQEIYGTGRVRWFGSAMERFVWFKKVQLREDSGLTYKHKQYWMQPSGVHSLEEQPLSSTQSSSTVHGERHPVSAWSIPRTKQTIPGSWRTGPPPQS